VCVGAGAVSEGLCVGRRKDRVGSFINLHKSVVEGRDKLHTVSFIILLLWSNNLRT